MEKEKLINMKSRNIGNSMTTNGYRVFKIKRKNGKSKCILLSWIDRHCKPCGKFLSKDRQKYCLECHLKGIKIYKRNYYQIHMEEIKEYARERYRQKNTC